MINRLLSTLFCLAACFFLWAPRCGAQQVFSNDDGIREANFAARVVLLDEFIRRFNNDSSSEIRRYYLSHHRPWVKTREQLIRSLFNDSNPGWDSLQQNAFIRRVTDRENPDRLGFLQDRWYAEARCGFLYNHVTVDVRLILRVQLNPDHTAEWVIAAVKPACELKEDAASAPVAPVGKKKLFIQPAANDTYFSELDRDFANKRELASLFDRRFFQRRSSGAFYEALLTDKLKFVAVREIKYHYLQVPDWIFTVENFDRPTRNSGWLITSIRRANAEERSDYEKKLLEE
jgi:hypothetical protein